MDASGLTVSFEQQGVKENDDRFSQEESVSEVKDRLTNLPDNLKRFILSFLPTNDAIATSILSTRWKYMWTSLPNLDIIEGMNDKDPVDKMKFMNFVDRVLNLHDETTINKFRIICRIHDKSCVNEWIFSVLKRKVQELDLTVGKGSLPFICLSQPLCNSETITVLKLQSAHGIVITTPFSLPNLKILHLRAVMYSSAPSRKPLISNCPSLWDLVLDDCHFPDCGTIIISIPKVEHLALYDYYRLYEMKIYAENLISFSYTGSLPKELHLHTSSSLVNACVEVTTNTASSGIGPRASMLLSQLSNVKYLYLAKVTILTLMLDQNHHDNLPTFRNLIHVVSSLGIPKTHVYPLVALLGNLPNVELVQLEKEAYPGSYDGSTEELILGDAQSRYELVEFEKVRGEFIYSTW